MRDFARVVLPYDAPNGAMLMLTSYFDDSGTHATSEVVLLGGVLGNQYQWEYFSDLWARKLKEPSPGKPPLDRFHMAECQAADGVFGGWGRTATDFLVHELGDIILESGLWSFGSAIFRRDWKELASPEMQMARGDPEGFCVRSCYLAALDFSKTRAWDPDMAFVFDDRPHRLEENRRVFNLFQKFGFKNTSLTFGSSSRILPLQAADLIAWEMYQHATAVWNGNAPKSGEFSRKQFARLANSGRCWFQLARRDDILSIINLPDDGWLSRTSHYFSTGTHQEISDEEVSRLLKKAGVNLPDFPASLKRGNLP